MCVGYPMPMELEITGRCEPPNLGSETDLELGSSAGGRVSHLSTLSSQEFLKMYQ